jgi:hypothetical protein
MLTAHAFTASAEGVDDQKKLADSKKYVMGNNLGIVAMKYSNITRNDALEIGFDMYDMYKETKKHSEVVKVWLLNTSGRIININPLNFKVVTEKGYTLPLSDYTFRTRNPFPSTNLEPRTKIEGFVVFGLEEKDNIVKIIYDDRQGNRVERQYKDAFILGFYERELKKLGIK